MSLAEESAITALELWDDECLAALAARAGPVRPQHRRARCTCSSRSTAWPGPQLARRRAGRGGAADRRGSADRRGDREPARRRMPRWCSRPGAGREAQARELIEATVQEATAARPGRLADVRELRELGARTTVSAATTPPATRPGGPSSTTELGYGPWSCPSWPRRRPGPVTPQLVRRRAGLAVRAHRRLTPTDWALGIEARVRALLSEGEAAERLYRESIDRLGRTRAARRAGPRSPALRRVAAPRAPPRRRARAAAHRPRHAGRDGHRGVRRAGPARAAGHRRDRPQAHRRRPASRADRPGGPGRAAGPRRPVQPGDRRPAVHQRRARSSTTWARSSPSSASARAASSTGPCPATRPPPSRTSSGGATQSSGSALPGGTGR